MPVPMIMQAAYELLNLQRRMLLPEKPLTPREIYEYMIDFQRMFPYIFIFNQPIMILSNLNNCNISVIVYSNLEGKISKLPSVVQSFSIRTM